MKYVINKKKLPLTKWIINYIFFSVFFYSPFFFVTFFTLLFSATHFTVPFFRRLCFRACYCEFFGDLFLRLFSATLLLRLLPWAQSTAPAGKWRRQIIVNVVSHRKNNERGQMTINVN